MTVVLHMMPLDAYTPEPGALLRPASLDSEGFVHCTADEQTLLAVANTYYGDADGPQIALEIDTERLSAEVRFEAAAPAPPPGVAADVQFPHVYGPIEHDAIVGVRHARRNVDGTYVGFERRPEIAEHLDLLPDGQTSHPHSVASQELWLWHGPGDLELTVDDSITTLGAPTNGNLPQVLVPAGATQSARARGDVLVSCVVSPGFDFADFRMH